MNHAFLNNPLIALTGKLFIFYFAKFVSHSSILDCLLWCYSFSYINYDLYEDYYQCLPTELAEMRVMEKEEERQRHLLGELPPVPPGLPSPEKEKLIMDETNV